MARLPRFLLPGQPQHVIQRGNNRGVIFVADEDYIFFKECLADAANRHGCDIHAYVLMTNHVHFLMTPHEEDGISKVLQSVGRRYVQYFNHIYQRTGTLWEGRYRATLIESEQYLLTCYRYIELNPVRAAMVSDPGDYPWSSYRHHVLGEPDSLVKDHSLYLALGQSVEERRLAYAELFKSELEPEALAAIRDATNKAWVLGSERFKAEIGILSKRRIQPLPKGRPKKKANNKAERVAKAN